MSAEIIKLLLQGIEETAFMVAVSGMIAALIGIPLGVTLVTTGKGHILENRVANQILGTVINIIRSIPFIILMVAIIPFTRMVAGTSIGTTAACVPLTIVAVPFLSRLVETSVRDIDFGLVEAAQSMGATPVQIIRKVLLPEALPDPRLWPELSAAAVSGILRSATAISASAPMSCWRLLSSSSSGSTLFRP